MYSPQNIWVHRGYPQRLCGPLLQLNDERKPLLQSPETRVSELAKAGPCSRSHRCDPSAKKHPVTLPQTSVVMWRSAIFLKSHGTTVAVRTSSQEGQKVEWHAAESRGTVRPGSQIRGPRSAWILPIHFMWSCVQSNFNCRKWPSTASRNFYFTKLFMSRARATQRCLQPLGGNAHLRSAKRQLYNGFHIEGMKHSESCETFNVFIT